MRICTNYWPKPIPTAAFDWCAWYDSDEPDDDGNMPQGYGATEQEAIDTLLMDFPKEDE